jgi:phosphoribosylformylglycinamidine cyclo-ligase
MSEQSYARAGVDITAGTRATELMTNAVKSTYGPEVLAGIGAFGGLFDAASLKNMEAPVLVASTDGVGTKTMVAAKMGRWDTIGQDLVNHCINDILVQGARPLFFLDYVASSKLDPEQIATVVGGVAKACREANCALLGGETAEMPGVYQTGELDLAGTIVGVVERAQVIDCSRIRPGDVILALPSNGLHTNGYSLARKVLADIDWTASQNELGMMSIGDALLAIHRSYLNDVRLLLDAGLDILGLAHITGGGLVDNLPRILPGNVAARLTRRLWDVPPIFNLIQRLGSVSDDEMFHVFNMGLGMLVIMPQHHAYLALATLKQEIRIVGEIIAGNREVTIN